MRRLIAWTCVAMLVIVSADAAFAAKKQSWLDHPLVVPFVKITRGTGNILKAPLDIPVTAWNNSRKSKSFLGAVAAFTGGAIEGVANGTAGVVAGAAEVVSFPLVHQKKGYYKKPLGYSPFRPAKKKTNRKRK